MKPNQIAIKKHTVPHLAQLALAYNERALLGNEASASKERLSVPLKDRRPTPLHNMQAALGALAKAQDSAAKEGIVLVLRAVENFRARQASNRKSKVQWIKNMEKGFVKDGNEKIQIKNPYTKKEAAEKLANLPPVNEFPADAGALDFFADCGRALLQGDDGFFERTAERVRAERIQESRGGAHKPTASYICRVILDRFNSLDESTALPTKEEVRRLASELMGNEGVDVPTKNRWTEAWKLIGIEWLPEGAAGAKKLTKEQRDAREDDRKLMKRRSSGHGGYDEQRIPDLGKTKD